MFTRMLAALLIITKTQKTAQMSISKRTDKQTVVYPYNGIVLSNTKEWTTDNGTTRMNLKNITLSERSLWFHLCEISKPKKKLLYGGNYIRTVVVSGEGLWELTGKSTFWGDSSVLYLYRGFSYLAVCICQNTSNDKCKIYTFHCMQILP